MRSWAVAAALGMSGLLVVAVAGGADGASRSDDLGIAEAGLLTGGDFPAGWTATPPDASDDRDIERAARRIASCKRYLTLRATGQKQPRAESPDFSFESSRIDNSVAVFASTRAANAAMKVFEHPTVLRCIDRLFADVLEAQLAADPATRDTITDVELDLDTTELDDLGDRAQAYEGTVTLSAVDGSQATVGVGIAAVRVGRAIALYNYFVDTAEVLQLLPGLVDTSVARLETAVA